MGIRTDAETGRGEARDAKKENIFGKRRGKSVRKGGCVYSE